MTFSPISEMNIVANLSAYRNELFCTQDEFTASRHDNRDLVIQRVRASGMTMASLPTETSLAPRRSWDSKRT